MNEAQRLWGESESEYWKEIPGFENYQVSNLGRVRSNKWGVWAIRKITIDRVGYAIVDLWKCGKRKQINIHRLVMMAFIGPSDLHVDHINGIKNDNRLENLRYCTHRENASFGNRIDMERKSSKYPGVSYHKVARKWSAYARVGAKRYHLGLFELESDAYNAYKTFVNNLKMEHEFR